MFTDPSNQRSQDIRLEDESKPCPNLGKGIDLNQEVVVTKMVPVIYFF